MVSFFYLQSNSAQYFVFNDYYGWIHVLWTRFAFWNLDSPRFNFAGSRFASRRWNWILALDSDSHFGVESGFWYWIQIHISASPGFLCIVSSPAPLLVADLRKSCVNANNVKSTKTPKISENLREMMDFGLQPPSAARKIWEFGAVLLDL